MFFLYFLSDVAYAILYYLIKYRREVVRKNLINSFPEKSEEEIIKIEKAFYHHFCDLVFEIGKILTASEKWGKKRLNIVNPELLEKYHKEERSVIFYMAHIGNWEMFSFLPLVSPYTLIGFYQPLSNKYFDYIVKTVRERFGGIGVMSSRGYKELMKFKRDGILTSTMIIGDQRPGHDSSMHWNTFLNQDTPFLIGADRIAKKSNQVLLYPDFSKSKRGFYNVEFKLIADNAKDLDGDTIINKYAALLEESVKKSPGLWLWSHNRWKYKRDQ